MSSPRILRSVGLAFLCDFRQAPAKSGGVNNGLLHVHGALVIRFHKSRQDAHGSSTRRAQKAEHGNLYRFLHRKQPAHELPVPVGPSFGWTIPAPGGAALLRQTICTSSQISLYIDLPIHYDENGESHYDGEQEDKAAKPFRSSCSYFIAKTPYPL
jgi:hypothetical protein